MIPAWLIRLLPQMGIAVGILAAVWWLDRAGYRRAQADRDARDAAMLETIRGDLRARELALADTIHAIASDRETQSRALARAGQALQPIAIKETSDDPRLADPAAGLTPGLLDAVNRARAAGACAATAAGRIECALPAIDPGAGTVDR